VFYDEYGEVIERVECTSNWTTGTAATGITRLADGRYVLIYGGDWQNELDAAEVIDADGALQEILQAEATELLEEPKFAELKKLWEKSLVDEME